MGVLFKYLKPGAKVPISTRTEQRRANDTYHSITAGESLDAFLWRYVDATQRAS